MQVIKEAREKWKCKQQSFPKKIIVDKKNISETKSLADNFDKWCTQTGPNLAKDICTSTKSFNKYIN